MLILQGDEVAFQPHSFMLPGKGGSDRFLSTIALDGVSIDMFPFSIG